MTNARFTLPADGICPVHEMPGEECGGPHWPPRRRRPRPHSGGVPPSPANAAKRRQVAAETVRETVQRVAPDADFSDVATGGDAALLRALLGPKRR